MAELRISPEKVCYVIATARALEAEIRPAELEDEPDTAGDGDPAAVDDGEDGPVFEELSAFLAAQSEEELVGLLALMWVGEGDYGLDEWDEALEAAADLPRRRIVEQLIATPLLGDFLEEGLAQFGLSCEDIETGFR